MATGYIYAGSSVSSGYAMGTPRYCGIQMGTNEYPKGNVSISGGAWYFNAGATGTTYTFTIWLCDSDGNNTAQIGTLSINGQQTKNGISLSAAVDKAALKGKKLYIKATGTNAAYLIFMNTMGVNVATVTDAYTITTKVSPTGAGTLTASKASAAAGETITLSRTDATGYWFSWYKTSPTVTISSGSFTMPAGNITITAMYRKRSTAELNRTDLEGGGTAVLTIHPDKMEYTHKYKLSFGTGMETDWIDVAAGVTSVSVSIPLSWSAEIPNQGSKTGGTMQVKTYYDIHELGTYTISGLTYIVPANVLPEVGTITASIVRTIGGTTYANVGDYYIQNHCGVRIQAAAQGAQGSTVESMTVSISGYTGSGYTTTVLAASVDWTSALLSIAGTATITVIATDSRGRTGSATATITVSAYSAPAGSIAVRRVDVNGDDDDMGTYGKYAISKSYTQIGTNALTVTISYSSGSVVNPAADSGDIFPGNRQTFPATGEYTFTLTLADLLETTVITAKMPSARFIIYADSTGNKLGFMKAANKSIPAGKARTIEFSADSQIYIGDVTLEQYIQDIING
jgi:hypothetical protein